MMASRIRRFTAGATRAMAVGMLIGATGCLSARAVERNYFVLHGDPIQVSLDVAPVDGLVRVRDMDTDSVYEKFQIVVRRSPYQLRYSDQNVWAVKPNQMVSDLIAQALEASNTFTGVSRELRDARPSYTMSGRVMAIELYDSGDLWFAHLSMHLYLTRFGDGAAIWAFEFDRRKEIGPQAFEHGVRALSELLHEAIRAAIGQVKILDATAVRRAPKPLRRPAAVEPSTAPPPASAERSERQELLFVPEGRRRSSALSTRARVATSTRTPSVR